MGSLACLAAMAQSTNVYSLPAVGYINITCPSGFSLASFQVDQYPNNDPAFTLNNTSGVFDGWQIMVWTNNNFAKYIGDHSAGSNAVNGWLEPDGPIQMNPGIGAVIYNASPDPYVITLVGTIPHGHLGQTLNVGLNLVGFFVPVSWGLSSQMSFPPLSNGQLDGDQALLLYDSGATTGYTVYTVDSLSYNLPTNLGWDGPSGQGEPFLDVGQAFWYRAANRPVQWTFDFAVNTAPSPELAQQPRRKMAGFERAMISGDSRFQAKLSGRIGSAYVVESSSNFKKWKAMETNTLLSSSWLYTDPEPATNTSRFYRVWKVQ